MLRTQREYADLLNRIQAAPGMWLLTPSTDTAIALLAGFDYATEGQLLVGFQPWLCTRAGLRPDDSRHWQKLLQIMVTSDTTPGDTQVRQVLELAIAYLQDAPRNA